MDVKSREYRSYERVPTIGWKFFCRFKLNKRQVIKLFIKAILGIDTYYSQEFTLTDKFFEHERYKVNKEYGKTKNNKD